MAPQPRRHRPQTQPITTTLANILRDYHAGGTVLRELLQNADDAGATRVDFHLHTSPAPSSDPCKLLHPSLLEFQGPSLLAYNNHPPFRPQDFESLSHVGDSGKRDDPNKTGKFGLGFNSVYNWTDAPSILSGDSLLLLDPHHGWSAEVGTPGGPIYDFVADGGTDEMKNQLKPFAEALVTHDFRQPLDGTAVRIPLRTEAQAQESRVCNRSVGVDEIRQVLQVFVEGLGKGYGVFLKSVKEVGLWENGGEIGRCEIVDGEGADRARSAINAAYNDVFVTGSRDEFGIAFEMEVKVSLSRDGGRDRRAIWAIQHLMRRDVGEELTEWGRERKLFGWVGIAAPVEGLSLDGFTGGLFTVLPLNKPTAGHPVHLHGLFSITSDRANLHSAGDGSDLKPFLWNEMLFDSLFPAAWTKLLGYLSVTRPYRRDLMRFWPRPQAVVDQLGNDICMKVFERVINEGLELFYAGQGYTSVNTAIFVRSEDVGEELRTALDAIGQPVAYLESSEDWLFKRVEATLPSRLLTPRALCNYLLLSASVTGIDPGTKAALLEYIITGIGISAPKGDFSILGGIPLFRLESGTYHAIGNGSPRIFICLDELERSLFQRRPERLLDCSLLSAESVALLEALARDGSFSISLHSMDDFSDYCMETIFSDNSEDEDVVPCSPDQREFADRAWAWIRSKWGGSCLKQMGKHWLIPLWGDYLRRGCPEHSMVPTLHSLSGPTGQLLFRLAALSQRPTPPPLLDETALSVENLKFLIHDDGESGGLAIGSCEKLANLLPWLVKGNEMMWSATDQDKTLALATIAAKFMGEMLSGTVNTDEIAKHLRQLPLFKRVETSFAPGGIEQTWPWIDGNGEVEEFVGVTTLPFVPSVDGVAFIYMEDEHVKGMLTATSIAQWPSITELLERYLIPALTHDTCRLLPSAVKLATAKLILRHYLNLSKECQASISQLPIVPVETSLADKEPQSLSISELFHPTAGEIDGLFFPDELLYPQRELFDEFSGVMIQCGLRSKLTWASALERIRMYAHTQRPLEEVAARVRRLLQIQVSQDTEYRPGDLEEVNSLLWIPVRHRCDRSDLARTSPPHCRSFRDRLLVGRVLPILECDVHTTWQNLLGWQTTLSVDTLVCQLQAGVAESDLDIVNAVLAYIARCGLQKDYLDALRLINCLLGSGGTLFLPSNVFIAGAAKLSPYLGNIHKGFQKQHYRLLEALGLSSRPSLQDLLQVQKRLLVARQPLSETDIAVAIEVVNLASTHDRGKLTELKIPDRNGRLQGFDGITFWDLEYSSAREKTPLVHPNIPQEVTDRLRIQPFSEKILMGKMGIHDQEDEDEFFQHEKATTRIADTLGRYPISTTFSEYLANAEDSGTASRVEWLLDECLNGNYPAESLLSKDLAAFQGQALFVHNDGVFRDGDFEGLRNVGRGSKREETWTIGQFGRGAQTMYHWTDVPMLISGKYFLVLDPQQRFLPLNRRYGRRKPGLKVELANIREICYDQLAPFDGLWGYSRDMDRYEGTIFRFPLRDRGVKTTLTESKVNLDVNAIRMHLENYFQTARLSLLFLQRIRQISFRLRHMKEPRFRVEYTQRLFPLLCTQPYRYIHISYVYRDAMQKWLKGTDEWWIAKDDVCEVPADLQEWQTKVRRRVKDSKCGIALLCSPPNNSISEPQMFSALPLPFASHLPVHINASFFLSGDRQSILVGGSSAHEGSAWNKWLLRNPIPKLYLNFLEQIVRRLGVQSYEYWPTVEPSRDGPSDLIRAGFWEEAAKSHNRLYPKAVRMLAPCDSSTGEQCKKQGEALDQPVWYELEEAVFDFISDTSSHELQDIFQEWFPRLVRVPGNRLSMGFKGLGSAMTELVPSMVRKKLQDADANDVLQEHADGSSGVLDDLLRIITPNKDAEASEIAELNGCPVLPLQDGCLGTLHYLEPCQSPQVYFCVTAEERKIFSFASSLFVRGEIIENHPTERSFRSSGAGKEFVAWVFNSSIFNVRELTVQDLGQLLRQRNASDWESAAALETWLEDFWFYFRIRMPIDKLGGTRKDIATHCGIEEFPIFQATKGGQTVHISPASFERLPTVIEPSFRPGGLLDLCRRFPDLYVVDRRMTPFLLEGPEQETAFFVSFLNAISKIASDKDISWESVVALALDDSSRKTLRDLTLRVLSDPKFDSVYGLVLQGIIGSLPVWPTTPGQYVTAYSALAATDERLVVPWLEQRHRFIENSFFREHSEKLKKLKVIPRNVTCMFRNHILCSIPERLQPEHQKAYCSLIQAMATFYEQEKKYSHLAGDKLTAEEEVKLLGRQRMTRYSTWKLAADADGVMHQAKALYDHDDKVYRAAYGLQALDQFLLPSVRCYRDFWQAMGLGGGLWKDISGLGYLNCLQSLEKRIVQLEPPTTQPPALLSDIGDVLQGIARVLSSGMPESVRNKIVSIPVVPTRMDMDTQPDFRRQIMQQLCDTKPYIPLSEVIHSDHVSCCWTQAPFPFRHLFWTDLNKFQLRASPPEAMVWNHLRALIDISATLLDSQVKDFLHDLSQTYLYLQGITSDKVPGLDHERLWLNMDVSESNPPKAQALSSLWMDASHMVLFCPYDPGEMKYVRSYLMPYEALLKKCGCQPIHNPAWTRSSAKQPSGPTMSEVSRLWKDQKLTDVVFSAEGQTIAAHKLVLAAASRYCEVQFTGPWSKISTGDDPIILEDIAHSTLLLMLTYAYDDTLDWTSLGASDSDTAAIADKLDVLLDVLAGADRWDMARLHAAVETHILHHARTFVRIDNVKLIEAIAADVQAKDLAAFCAEYRNVNRDILAVVDAEIDLHPLPPDAELPPDPAAEPAPEEPAAQLLLARERRWGWSWRGLLSLVSGKAK